MRVSSSAPALSRRSVMKGLACGLAGAAVPVAAIAGMTASRLTAQGDAELIGRCNRWKNRRQDMKAKEQRLRLLADEAARNTPAMSPELLQKFHIRGIVWAYPSYPISTQNRDPWTKKLLGRILKAEGGATVPTEACRAHVHRLMGLIDRHQQTKAAAWAGYYHLDQQWERQYRKNEKLLTVISETEAQTLQGVSAQIEVLQLDGVFSESCSEEVCALTERIMSNLLRLVAALPAGA